MKPLKGDQQLRSVSLSYSVAAPGVRTKSLSTKRRGLDARTDRGLTERSGEGFLLDILSQRMSELAQLQHLPKLSRCRPDRSDLRAEALSLLTVVEPQTPVLR